MDHHQIVRAIFQSGADAITRIGLGRPTARSESGGKCCLGRVRNNMNQTRDFALICAGILIITILGLGLTLTFGDLGFSSHGYIALVLGVVLTMALAMLLMGLVFWSNRSGHDEVTRSERDRQNH